MLTLESFALSMNAGETTYATRYEFEYNPNVTTVGNYSVSTDQQAIWHYTAGTYSYTTAAMQLLDSQDMYVQFWHSDSNDGSAKIETRVEGSGTWVVQGYLDTYNGGQQYALIDGLDAGNYYLRITAVTGTHGDDLHLGHFGATNAVPEPATMLLLGFGLVGLTGARRFKK